MQSSRKVTARRRLLWTTISSLVKSQRCCKRSGSQSCAGSRRRAANVRAAGVESFRMESASFFDLMIDGGRSASEPLWQGTFLLPVTWSWKGPASTGEQALERAHAEEV